MWREGRLSRQASRNWVRARLPGVLVGVVLATAAAGKLGALVREPVAAWAFVLGPVGYIALCAWEGFLGTQLVLHPTRYAVAAAVATFGLFVGYHIWVRAGGGAACGCFGILEVSDDWALAVAVLSLGASCAAWIGLSPHASYRQQRLYWPLAIGAGIGCALLLAASVVVAQQGATDGIRVGKRIIWVEPQQWLGRPFPLRRFVTSWRLEEKDYVAAVIREGCSRCDQFLEHLNSLRWSGSPRLVVLVADARDSSPGRIDLPGPVYVWNLDSRWQWSIPTPSVVLIRDGLVVKVGDENLLLQLARWFGIRNRAAEPRGSAAAVVEAR